MLASGETKTINELVRRDFESLKNKQPLKLGLGTVDKKITIDGKVVEFKFFNEVYGTIVFIAAVILAIAFFIYLVKIKAIDESSTNPEKSLRKFQLLFWTIIIMFSYFTLWLILHDAPILPPNVLILLTISLATTGISTVIQSVKGSLGTGAVAGQVTYTPATNGIRGLLVNQNNEFAISRLQYLIFTLMFGAAFISSAIFEFRIYDISAQQLTMMGISAAGYVGVKAVKNDPTINALARRLRTN